VEPRQTVWLDHNRRHITEDHPERDITQDDVNHVLADPDREEQPDHAHGTVVARGRDELGRIVVVAFVELSDGTAFPVHARRMSE
jgi:hypothetical protein